MATVPNTPISAKPALTPVLPTDRLVGVRTPQNQTDPALRVGPISLGDAATAIRPLLNLTTNNLPGTDKRVRFLTAAQLAADSNGGDCLDNLDPATLVLGGLAWVEFHPTQGYGVSLRLLYDSTPRTPAGSGLNAYRTGDMVAGDTVPVRWVLAGGPEQGVPVYAQKPTGYIFAVNELVRSYASDTANEQFFAATAATALPAPTVSTGDVNWRAISPSTLPAPVAPLYGTTGTNTNGAMTQAASTTALGLKVDKVAGLALSSNDYTSPEKAKLAALATATNLALGTVRGGGTGNVNINADGSMTATAAAAASFASITGLPTDNANLTTALTAKLNVVDFQNYSVARFYGVPTDPTRTAVTGTNRNPYVSPAEINGGYYFTVGGAVDVYPNSFFAAGSFTLRHSNAAVAPLVLRFFHTTPLSATPVVGDWLDVTLLPGQFICVLWAPANTTGNPAGAKWSVVAGSAITPATSTTLGTVRGGGTGNVNINADGSMTATAAAAAASFASLTGAPADNANLTTALNAKQAADTFAVLTYAASIALDFAAATVQTLAAAGSVTFTTANRAALKYKQLTITNTTGAAITISAEAWAYLGPAVVTSLPAGKKLKLTLQCLGPNIADVEAANVLFV